MMRFQFGVLIVLVITLVGGCGRFRFVIDAVPAADALTETIVFEDESNRWFQSKIALIDFSGVIHDAPQPGLLAPGENPISRFTESLRRAERDSAVKAVILRINSPGGTVTASDVLHREVKRFTSRSGKPFVVLMADVAASGGYYVACAADEIIAHPTTVTGSIGVLIQTINVSEGLRKIGVRADAITSGRNKAMGSPFEPMLDEHRELLQGLVDEFYENFETIVTENRPQISPSDLELIRDGRVVTGKQAATVGLVDRLGDLHDAFEAAKSRASVQSARLVKYHRPLEHVGSAYAKTPVSDTEINFMQLNLTGASLSTQPNFYYLWVP